MDNARGNVVTRQSAAELTLLRRLRATGLRPQTQVRVWSHRLPGKFGYGHTSIDYAWKRLGVAAFFDGCYWHGCPDHYPNRTAKRLGDDLKTQVLTDLGWTVVRVWECEPIDLAVNRIVAALNERRAT